MKKILVLLAIGISLISTGRAQKITYNISAGISYANTFIKLLDPKKEAEGLGSKTGFTGGISATIPFSKLFSFQPGINYVQKGFKYEKDQATFKMLADYIEVPLNIMFSTGNRNNDRKADDFFFCLGPTIAFATSGKMEYLDDTSRTVDKIQFGSSHKDDLKRLDIGANVVMGCTFYNNIFFSIIYNMGLSNLSVVKDVRWRNNYLGFKIGYSFGGKRK